MWRGVGYDVRFSVALLLTFMKILRVVAVLRWGLGFHIFPIVRSRERGRPLERVELTAAGCLSLAEGSGVVPGEWGWRVEGEERERWGENEVRAPSVRSTLSRPETCREKRGLIQTPAWAFCVTDGLQQMDCIGHVARGTRWWMFADLVGCCSVSLFLCSRRRTPRERRADLDARSTPCVHSWTTSDIPHLVRSRWGIFGGLERGHR